MISGDAVTAYGVMLRLTAGESAPIFQTYKNATVWINVNGIDDNPSTPTTLALPVGDAGSNVGTITGVPPPIVHANRRINKEETRIPFTKVGNAGTWEALFTAPRTTLAPGGGVISRLELRRSGEDQTALPFYSIALDIPRLTTNEASDGSSTGPTNGSNVRYDDFVVEIRVSTIVTFRSGGNRISAVNLPDATSSVAIEMELLDNAANGIQGIPATFSLANAGGDTRINGAAAPAPLNTDTNGKVSVTITRAGPNVCPVVVSFVRGTDYPQTFTIPVVVQ